MTRMTGPTAALAGIPSGLQARGPWTGRRQLFIRFAAEAETATMYTASALAQELERITKRAAYHSLAVGGRDPLANGEFLRAALGRWSDLPVLLDTDGQRPEALAEVRKQLDLVQVTPPIGGGDAVLERALQTLAAAAETRLEHALVLEVHDETSDGQLLRIVEQAHAASAGTMIVVHPPAGASGALSRRWLTLMEQAVGMHADTRLLLRLPPPVGMS